MISSNWISPAKSVDSGEKGCNEKPATWSTGMGEELENLKRQTTRQKHAPVTFTYKINKALCELITIKEVPIVAAFFSPWSSSFPSSAMFSDGSSSLTIVSASSCVK
jgi:hypothetical protein